MIYLIDFGLCKKLYLNDGIIINPSMKGSFHGTIKYASINAHLGKELGRNDDLMSLIYILVELYTGTLPWGNVNDPDEVLRLKELYQGGSLLVKMPSEFKQFEDHILSLDYTTEPDYQLLTSILYKIASNNQIDINQPFDWEIEMKQMREILIQEKQKEQNRKQILNNNINNNSNQATGTINSNNNSISELKQTESFQYEYQFNTISLIKMITQMNQSQRQQNISSPYIQQLTKTSNTTVDTKQIQSSSSQQIAQQLSNQSDSFFTYQLNQDNDNQMDLFSPSQQFNQLNLQTQQTNYDNPVIYNSKSSLNKQNQIKEQKYIEEQTKEQQFYQKQQNQQQQQQQILPEMNILCRNEALFVDNHKISNHELNTNANQDQQDKDEQHCQQQLINQQKNLINDNQYKFPIDLNHYNKQSFQRRVTIGQIPPFEIDNDTIYNEITFILSENADQLYQLQQQQYQILNQENPQRKFQEQMAISLGNRNFQKSSSNLFISDENNRRSEFSFPSIMSDITNSTRNQQFSEYTQQITPSIDMMHKYSQYSNNQDLNMKNNQQNNNNKKDFFHKSLSNQYFENLQLHKTTNQLFNKNNKQNSKNNLKKNQSDSNLKLQFNFINTDEQDDINNINQSTNFHHQTVQQGNSTNQHNSQHLSPQSSLQTRIKDENIKIDQQISPYSYITLAYPLSGSFQYLSPLRTQIHSASQIFEISPNSNLLNINQSNLISTSDKQFINSSPEIVCIKQDEKRSIDNQHIIFSPHLDDGNKQSNNINNIAIDSHSDIHIKSEQLKEQLNKENNNYNNNQEKQISTVKNQFQNKSIKKRKKQIQLMINIPIPEQFPIYQLGIDNSDDQFNLSDEQQRKLFPEQHPNQINYKEYNQNTQICNQQSQQKYAIQDDEALIIKNSQCNTQQNQSTLQPNINSQTIQSDQNQSLRNITQQQSTQINKQGTIPSQQCSVMIDDASSFLMTSYIHDKPNTQLPLANSHIYSQIIANNKTYNEYKSKKQNSQSNQQQQNAWSLGDDIQDQQSTQQQSIDINCKDIDDKSQIAQEQLNDQTDQVNVSKSQQQINMVENPNSLDIDNNNKCGCCIL